MKSTPARKKELRVVTSGNSLIHPLLAIALVTVGYFISDAVVGALRVVWGWLFGSKE